MADLSLKGIARRYLSRSPPFDVRGVLSIPTTEPIVSLKSRLESIATREISFGWMEQCNGNTFGGTAAYLQIWTHIVVRIRLNFDPNIPVATQNNLMNSWGAAIRSAWSNKWGCGVTGESTCRLTFDVQWTGNNPHHNVAVDVCADGTPQCRENAGRWFDITSGNIAAHEFGHLLGLRDEYQPIDPTECPIRNPVNTRTIMDNLNSTCWPARLMMLFANNIGSQIVPIDEYSHNPTLCN